MPRDYKENQIDKGTMLYKNPKVREKIKILAITVADKKYIEECNALIPEAVEYANNMFKKRTGLNEVLHTCSFAQKDCWSRFFHKKMNLLKKERGILL